MKTSAKLRLAGLSLALLTSCNSLLGLELRTYVAPVEPSCSTSLECTPGTFCNDAQCTTVAPAVPKNLLCQVLEPQGIKDFSVGNVDWTKPSQILGGLLRLNNESETARVDAMRLAVREINANQGVGPANSPLVFVGCDYGGMDGTAAGDEAKSAIELAIPYLANELGVRVMVAGAASSATEAAISFVTTNKLSVALISSFSTSTKLSDYDDKLPGGKFGLLWRTAPDDTEQARVLAQLALSTKGLTKLGILYIDDAYGSPLNDGVSLALKGTALEAVVSVPFSESPTPEEFAAKVTDLFSKMPAPNGLLFVGIDGAMVLEAYTALDKAGKSTVALLPTLFLADAAKEGAILFDKNQTPSVQTLIKRSLGTAPFHKNDVVPYTTMAGKLKSDFGVNADDYSFVAQSYDAVFLAAYGLTWASANFGIFSGENVAEGFTHVSAGTKINVGPNQWAAAKTALHVPLTGTIDMEGTSGALQFDANGQAPGPMEIWRVNEAYNAFETCAVCEPTDATCALDKCFPASNP